MKIPFKSLFAKVCSYGDCRDGRVQCCQNPTLLTPYSPGLSDGKYWAKTINKPTLFGQFSSFHGCFSKSFAVWIPEPPGMWEELYSHSAPQELWLAYTYCGRLLNLLPTCWRASAARIIYENAVKNLASSILSVSQVLKLHRQGQSILAFLRTFKTISLLVVVYFQLDPAFCDADSCKISSSLTNSVNDTTVKFHVLLKYYTIRREFIWRIWECRVYTWCQQ